MVVLLSLFFLFYHFFHLRVYPVMGYRGCIAGMLVRLLVIDFQQITQVIVTWFVTDLYSSLVQRNVAKTVK